MEFKENKNRVNHHYFDIIDTENKAYLLGFFIADGCVSIEHENSLIRSPNYRFTINNSIDDKDIIIKLKEEICPFSNISIIDKLNNDKIIRKIQYKLRWSSKKMFDVLYNKYNIKPRKTNDLYFKFPFEHIPEHLIRHFIRGFFDGDGNITFHKYKKSIQFNFSLFATSLLFSEQICKIFEGIDSNITRTLRSVKSKNLTCYQIRFKYNRKRVECIHKIYDWLYNDSTIYLSRKKIKFENYFQYRANSTFNIVE